MKKRLTVLTALILLGTALASVGWMTARAAEKNVAPELNAYVPEFALKDLQGKTVELRDVFRNNKVTLVNFWATWCPPCRGEIPELNRIYSEYSTKSVAIVGVNLQEDPQNVQVFAKAHDMKFTILEDRDGGVAQTYRIYYIPDTFVVDRTGKIRRIIQGATTYNELKRTIDTLLKEG